MSLLFSLYRWPLLRPGAERRGGILFGADGTKSLGIYKLEEFGVPDVMGVIEVKDFPVVVTMRTYGQSKHSALDESSKTVLDDLLAQPYK